MLLGLARALRLAAGLGLSLARGSLGLGSGLGVMDALRLARGRIGLHLGLAGHLTLGLRPGLGVVNALGLRRRLGRRAALRLGLHGHLGRWVGRRAVDWRGRRRGPRAGEGRPLALERFAMTSVGVDLRWPRGLIPRPYAEDPAAPRVLRRGQATG